MSTAVPEQPKGRIRQLIQAYRITKRSDKNIGLVLLLTFLVTGGLFGALSWLGFGSSTLGLILSAVLGLFAGLLGVLIVFGRRAEKAAYLQVEGQAGAAAGALQMMRRGWETKAAVAFTKNQDVVHRAIGRAGVVLVGEGSGPRVRQLLAAEKKKHARIVGEDVPVIEIVIGRGEGEVPLPQLTRKLRKLPKKIKGAEMLAVINKVKALDSMRPTVPMPRGPMSGNALRGARKAMRG